MNKIIQLSALLIIMQITFFEAKASAKFNSSIHQTVQDTASGYTGKYQKTIHGDLFYINVEFIGGELICTTLWDGNKLALKHLSGDKFIVSGLDWSVEFLRDKDKKVTQVQIRGTDYWVKVKN